MIMIYVFLSNGVYTRRRNCIRKILLNSIQLFFPLPAVTIMSPPSPFELSFIFQSRSVYDDTFGYAGQYSPRGYF